jgi:hypothetical protein
VAIGSGTSQKQRSCRDLHHCDCYADHLANRQGKYLGAQSVVLSDTTSGVTIDCTTNGSLPQPHPPRA